MDGLGALAVRFMPMLAGALAIGLTLRWWLGRNYFMVTVDGESMLPALDPGQEVMAKRCSSAETCEIVVVKAPDDLLGWSDPDSLGDGYWIKRVEAVAGDPVPGSEGTVPDGHYWLASDNPAGSGSERHGLCPEAALLGKVTRHA